MLDDNCQQDKNKRDKTAKGNLKEIAKASK